MKQGYTQIGGKFYKECSVVMLSTERPLENGKQLHLSPSKVRLILPVTGAEGRKLRQEGLMAGNFKAQNLYFLSDEEIKKGDWCLIKHKQAIYQSNGNTQKTKEDFDYPVYKVIATTDPELTDQYGSDGEIYGVMKSGLPRPSTSFIEKFVSDWNAGDNVEKVLIEMMVDKYDKRNQYEDVLTGKYSYNKPAEQTPDSLYTNAQYYIPKIAPDNTITIKPLVEKIYSREEVKNILIDLYDNQFDIDEQRDVYLKWIEQNL